MKVLFKISYLFSPTVIFVGMCGLVFLVALIGALVPYAVVEKIIIASREWMIFVRQHTQGFWGWMPDFLGVAFVMVLAMSPLLIVYLMGLLFLLKGMLFFELIRPNHSDYTDHFELS